jgi:hypothetical protein
MPIPYSKSSPPPRQPYPQENPLPPGGPPPLAGTASGIDHRASTPREYQGLHPDPVHAFRSHPSPKITRPRPGTGHRASGIVATQNRGPAPTVVYGVRGGLYCFFFFRKGIRGRANGVGVRHLLRGRARRRGLHKHQGGGSAVEAETATSNGVGGS